MHRFRWLVALSLFVFAALALAQHELADPLSKKVAKASDEGQKAIKRFQMPAGVTAELWAAEPLLANPVAFCLDEKGNIYVAETFRLHNGVTDNRGHGNWMDDELAARTVADRLELYKKYKYSAAGTPDRVRMLYSSKGDGKIDAASIFADSFDRPEDGIGSGVLAHRGNVYYTCIPDLWLLKDTKGDHKADVKKSLSTGHGVHVSFIGHDSHGLKLGPDGKLYFSIGDRGLNTVTAEGRKIEIPDTGAVLRCNLDGSELELVHAGLRNPQELAFDKYGNLFTVDNNADGGDRARLTHIVDGGDTGWRIGHQYLPGLGTWNKERTWQPHNPDRSAYFVPALHNIISGPSGFTYHPGVAQLPEKYKDNFFICDFRGGSGGSSIVNFSLKPKGASFELAQKETPFLSSILATDCDFGPDGGFYVSDWVEGWGLTGKGRIYRFADPKLADDPLIKSTKELIGAGMAKRDNKELAQLLSHDDMRVRLESQYTLAERKAAAELEGVAMDSKNLLARLHAVWGLGQIGRKDPGVLKAAVVLLDDPEVELRANAAKVLGEAKYSAAASKLTARLKDASPRVQFQAAIALGRTGTVDAVPAFVELLAANNDADPYLRHAAFTGLASLKDVAPALTKLADHPSPAVRMGAVLALRKLEHEGAAKFLNDADPNIVLEAARAIYDTPIPAGMPALAKLVDRPLPDAKLMPTNRQEYLLRRAVSAHARLGGADSAKALVALATRASVPEAVRIEALGQLQSWTKKVGRDPVVGVWRPIDARPGEPVAEALRASLAPLMTGPDKVRGEAAKLAAQHGIKEMGPFLRSIVTDPTKPAILRVDTLKALVALKDADLGKIAESVSKDADGRLRHESRRILLAKSTPAEIATELSKVLESATLAEKQGALEWLADLKANEADDAIRAWREKLTKKDVPAEIQLDILEAAARRGLGNQKTDGREALVGGDADLGRKLFHDKTELSCLRCHKINGAGGDVGPDLTGLGKRVKREYILDAILAPDKDIAKGFETVVLTLTNGQVKSGILKSEDKNEVRLMTSEGQLLVVPTAQIDERNRGPSAMPADLKDKMSRRELRDLVEYLSGL